MNDTGMGEGSNDPQEPEVEIPQKGTITITYMNGMSMIFNTLWTKEEFEDRYDIGGDKIHIPMDHENVRVISYRHIAFMDYGPLQDMDALREELKKKQEEAKAAQNSNIIRPGQIGRKRLQ